MVERLREKDPSARITWVCGREVESLLCAYGKIDELIVVDEKALLKGNALQRLQVMMGLWGRLCFRSFDRIVTGNADPRYRILSWTARSSERRSFHRQKSRPHPIPGRFFGDEYVRLVMDVDGPQALLGNLPRMVQSLPAHLKEQLKDRPVKRIALVPGGAKNTLRDNAVRRWPLENYGQLAAKLLQAGHQVLVVGATSDEWVLSVFKGLPVTDLVGKTDLTELVSVFNECDLVISHDCGPMHLAALAGAPLIALFGPTDPQWFVDRSKTTTQVIWGGERLACRPCYDGRNFADCDNNLCMKSIEVEKVHQLVLGSLR